MTFTPEIDRRKLLYRSSYRGCKETDLLVGGFVKARIAALSEEEVATIEQLLDESDTDIYQWIIGKIAAPSVYHRLIQDIRDFHVLSAGPTP